MPDNESQPNEIEHPEHPKADKIENAVMVSQWRSSEAIVIGNKQHQEWLTAPARLAIDVSAIR
jgi:uncharacterized protein YdaT